MAKKPLFKKIFFCSILVGWEKQGKGGNNMFPQLELMKMKLGAFTETHKKVFMILKFYLGVTAKGQQISDKEGRGRGQVSKPIGAVLRGTLLMNFPKKKLKFFNFG